MPPATTNRLACAVLLALAVVGCRQNPSLSGPTGPIDYVETRRDTGVVDDYHGTLVPDPYRWLEDDRSDETAAWVGAQNRVTDAYLEAIPSRDRIERRLEQLYDYERIGVPEVVGGWLYYTLNDGLRPQPLLLRERPDGTEQTVVLDPNTFSDDATSSLSTYAFSDGGQYLAYQISEAGSDWKTVRVRDLRSLEDLDERLAWVKFSGLAWAGDGFFYSRYPEPEPDVSDEGSELSQANAGHQVFYHRLGTPQSDDVLVREFPGEPERNVGAAVSDDGRYLIITSSRGTSGNDVAIATLGDAADALAATPSPSAYTILVEGFEADYSFAGSRGSLLYFWTNDEAPAGALEVIDGAEPAAGWRTVIEPAEGAVLKSVSISGDRAYARTLEEVSSRLYAYDLSAPGASPTPIGLPGLGTSSGVSAPEGGGDGYVSFSSFTTPGEVYRLDSVTATLVPWRSADNGFRVDDYETKQVRYRSADGTEVPMFIIHRRGLGLDGQRPTLLYGYGGFDISIEPRHSVMRLDLFSPLLEQGGVAAVANIRGGGEFGEEWHAAGTKAAKQNVFDDFIAAAEYLQAEGYTSPERTAIYGRSNGGLLVGACITQRPDLFGVAFPAVGVLDMLRYHRFTIGWAWASDYGRADSAAAFPYLYAYSPLHNAEPARYPATLITTADHDDRVVPAHSFKFAAELQRSQRGEAPVLIRIDESSGHGAGKPIGKQISEAADVLAFMFYNMGLDYEAPST